MDSILHTARDGALGPTKYADFICPGCGHAACLIIPDAWTLEPFRCPADCGSVFVQYVDHSDHRRLIPVVVACHGEDEG